MKSKCIFVLLVLFELLFSTASYARAEAPVIDLSPTSQIETTNQGLEIDQEEAPSRSSISHQSEPMEQRVLRLEKQIENMAEMNYPSKLEKMQQEVQQLHGQIEVQNHELTQLKEQLKNFYQDLDQRVSKTKSNESAGEKNSKIAANGAKIGTEDTLSKDAETNKTKELQTYEAAFNLLNKKDYEKATQGFQQFLKDYPESNYAVNAHYWLGEIYYLKGKPEQANKEFQNIITSYPDNPKVADATLKVALIAMDAGNYTKAKQNLTKVQKQFPSSTAAKIAALRLREIKKGGLDESKHVVK